MKKEKSIWGYIAATLSIIGGFIVRANNSPFIYYFIAIAIALLITKALKTLFHYLTE